MSTVELGAALRKKPTDYGPLADIVSSMQDAITQDVLLRVTEMVTRAVVQGLDGGLNVAAPHVSVQAPNVAVAAPDVSVAAPNVTVNIPEDDDTDEIMAIQAQTEAMNRLNASVVQLIAVLRQPVTRSVIRDSKGLIDRVEETR